MEEEFNKIRNEIDNFNERIEQGDIFIPVKLLRSKELNTNEKMYLATYYSFNKNKKKADEYTILEKNKLSKIKKHLASLNYINIKIRSAEQIKIQTIKNQFIETNCKCEWCGRQSYVLQQHHFPIPANKGGTKTVNICPNCHYTFHKLEGEIYE